MATYRVKGLKALKSVLKKHDKARRRQLAKAVRKTARQGAALIRKRVPVAFSELRDSIHAEGHRIVADAPHAAAVETGRRPGKMPPIAPIERWVKLRGMQALTGKAVSRLPGTSTAHAASAVGAAIKSYEKGGAVDINAPRRIAFLIARAIGRRGTKPTWYMKGALPELEEMLDRNIKEALARMMPGAHSEL